jgi:hypothetical protein
MGLAAPLLGGALGGLLGRGRGVAAGAIGGGLPGGIAAYLMGGKKKKRPAAPAGGPVLDPSVQTTDQGGQVPLVNPMVPEVFQSPGMSPLINPMLGGLAGLLPQQAPPPRIPGAIYEDYGDQTVQDLAYRNPWVRY